MLVKCPECELQVSSNAATCPHCGYPLKPTRNSRPRATSNKRRRLPNGFGQISEIKGSNLRNPFRAMVTVGKSETGRPICKPLKPVAYFPTYNDAYMALMEYHKNPYDAAKDITMNELYERWSEEYFKKDITETWRKAIRNAWSQSESIHNIRVRDIRTWHLKTCLESGNIAIHTANIMKMVMNKMLDYAMEYDLVDKNYARIFTVDHSEDPESNGHIAYTDDEMELLWINVDLVPLVDVVLIQCYSGWRPQELCNMRLTDVDLENGIFVGGMKTKAGKNRTVPIHSKIMPLVRKRYEEAVSIGSDFLFNHYITGKYKPLNYSRFTRALDKIIDVLDLNPVHRPHDGRKEFITLAKKYKVDEYAIKYLVGHNITDITEKVYTERSIDWLKTEIENIR